MRILDAAAEPRLADSLTGQRWEPDRSIEMKVREILEAVQRDGDEAVANYTRQLDCKFIDSLGLRVSDRERDGAYDHVSKEFLRALRASKANIKRFHKKQLPKSWTLKEKGVSLEQRFSPLARVGIYIPGGKASYPSTVMMNAIPALIAGVNEIVMVTPCNQEGKIQPEVLAAADECGVTEIYRIGGAQAIAALAFGTQSIRRVDKITGPGNAYVAAAKQMVYGIVGIDVIAGPTEVVIVADESAPAGFIAADLIAQAEHDERATPIFVTTSKRLAREVEIQISLQLENAPRRAIARRAFDDRGAIVIVKSLDAARTLVNAIAPEHLEVMVKNPGKFSAKIKNAGSIFVGLWSTEALGDYAAGPNHTLPTNGTARFSSPLGVMDYMKFSNVIEFSRKEFLKLAPHVETLAVAEGLHGHAASVAIRRKKK